MTTLLPPSAVGCASRSSLPPPAHCQASGLGRRERRLGGSLGGGLAMRVRVLGVRPWGRLCSSSPLPPPLPVWGRADPRVTGKAVRRARAEA